MIFGIQTLRGLAAMMVVFAHLQPQLAHFGGPSLTSLGIGGSGVDIFFVISGFIIWVTSQSPRMTAPIFLVRRAIRIVPLYWLATAVIAGVALGMPALLSSTRFEFSHVMASFLFIPAVHPVLNEIYPILVPGWSLNYEAFFYALFGCALLLPNRLASVGVVLGALILLALGGLLLRPTGVVASFYCNPIILEFAFGLWVGVFYTHLPKPPLWLGLVAIPLGLLGVLGFGLAGMVDNQTRVVLVGLPAALSIWGVTVAKRHGLDPKWPVAVALGDASYSIYLTHVMVLPAAARLWSLVGIGYDGWRLVAFMSLEVLLAAGIGYAVHRLVEQPMLDLLRARFEPARPQLAAAQAP